MKIIKPSFEIMFPEDFEKGDILQRIERIARTCYKSEAHITEGSAEKLVRSLVKRGHFPMLDHHSISVKIVCDRGVSHEIVRHRIAAYAQESTRYCNYSKDKFGNHLTFIKPCFFPDMPTGEWELVEWPKYDFNEAEEAWFSEMKYSEERYLKMIKAGSSPQEARDVLPNSLKTEIVCTLDLTAWRHFFKLRTATAAHPQMREIAVPMLEKFRELVPIVFEEVAE